MNYGRNASQEIDMEIKEQIYVTEKAMKKGQAQRCIYHSDSGKEANRGRSTENKY